MKEFLIKRYKIIILGMFVTILLGVGIFLVIKNSNKSEIVSESEENNTSTTTTSTTESTTVNDDYKEYSVDSHLVKDLYSKVTYNLTTLDCYIEGKITNDTIITLTLQQMERDKKYVEISYYDDILEYDDVVFYFSSDDFDLYAKRLFGNNIKYDIPSYNGAGNGCGAYTYIENSSEFKNNGLYAVWGTGCGLYDEVIKKIDKAYKKGNQFVIIEKTLYYKNDNGDEPVYIDIYDYSFKNGLYNNFNDKVFLTDEYLDDDIDYLSKYSDYATYYSYTFNKDTNGYYYYVDFSRVK